MLICLYLYHPTVTSLTKCKILRSIFHEEMYEIQVVENNTVVIYLWNVQMDYVKERVHKFEMTGIKVGYGLGERKADAADDAWAHLYGQINKEITANGHDLFI